MMKKIICFSLLLVLTSVIIYNLIPEPKLPPNIVIDYIVVKKAQRKLMVYSGGKFYKTYKISLGANPIGHKVFEGDERTPEGRYFINAKNPNSGYHKNLGVSYPNAKDIATAIALGKLAGGDIKIHGIKNNLGFIGKLQRLFDWTNGCMALTDNEIDELYKTVKIGASINILP